MIIHKPVLLKESMELLRLKPGMAVIDATLGGGGHSREILKKILPGGTLIAVDRDKEAIDKFKINLKPNLEKENVILINDNFAFLKDIVSSLKIKKVDAIAADLGISSDQLEDADRGFSFSKDGPLDMRMNQKERLTAFDVINSYTEKELARIFKEYGEERYGKSIARAVAEKRKSKLISTTLELISIVESVVPEKYKHRKLHPATKTFQALRIEVNKEIENLKKFLSEAVEVLAEHGRLAIISFHSGEDKIVKQVFRENARGCICLPNFPICNCGKKETLKIITQKPITPSAEEVKRNPRSRSAKLRVAEKI